MFLKKVKLLSRIVLFNIIKYADIPGLAQAFRELGYEVVIVDQPTGSHEWKMQIEDAFRLPCVFALGFQCEGIDIKLSKNGESIYDALNIPYVSYMVETPYNSNSILLNTKLKHLITLHYDKSHIELLKYCFEPNHIKIAAFLPWAAGSIIDELNPEDLEKRNIPMLFMGNNHNFHRIWRRSSPSFTKLFDDIIEYACFLDYVSLNGAIDRVLKYSGLYLEIEERRKIFTKNNLHFLDSYIRTERRKKLLHTIARSGLYLEVYGKGWNELSEYKNLYVPNTLANKSILGNAKILINENAFLPDGGHERVFSAMAYGAAVISDRSSYYDEQFSKEEMELYSWNNLDEVPSLLCSLSNQLSKIGEMSKKGKKTINDNHLWINRAKYIHNIIHMYKGMNNF